MPWRVFLTDNRSVKRSFNLLFWLILAVGTYKRWLFPLVPFFNADSWGYFAPVVEWDLGKPFLLIYGRHHVYPLFLASVLALAPRLESISFAQHLLAVLGMIILWRAWDLLPHPAGIFGQIAASLCSLTAITSYFLNPTVMFYEHSVRPESIFPFLCIVSVYAFLRFFLVPLEQTKQKCCWGILCVFVFGISYFVKPQWGLGVCIPLVAYLHWGVQSKRELRLAMLSGCAGMLALLALGPLPYKYLARADRNAGVLGATAITFCNAHITKREVELDLDDL